MNASNSPLNPLSSQKLPSGTPPLSPQTPVTPFSQAQQPTYTDPWEKMIAQGCPGLSPSELKQTAAKMKAQALTFVAQDAKKRMDKLREDIKEQQREYGS